MKTGLQMKTWRDMPMARPIETCGTCRDQLAACGFTPEEIAALFRLQHWYQTGGSDRMELVRHWAFLKFLVHNGHFEEKEG